MVLVGAGQKLVQSHYAGEGYDTRGGKVDNICRHTCFETFAARMITVMGIVTAAMNAAALAGIHQVTMVC